ncbi:MAG: RagB/SusD family nutrient uptake outer membrane protein [Chitinophagaceae bacterium]|nr:MAG: RagB/SusD family nutrient uptake outer membrane protein [Chitinophagaceae bacterium]
MKSIISIITISVSSMLLFSCNKNSEFLRENMQSNTSTEDFYKTPNDFEIALTGAYAAISNGRLTNHDDFTRGILIAQAAGTDELAARFDWGDGDPSSMSRLGRLSVTPLTPSYLPGIWQVLYAGINRANLLLERIDGVDFPDAVQKKRIIAEAKFLRGFYHFYASMLWGGIPLVTSTAKEKWTAPRSSVEEVYNQIEADFTTALPDLALAPTTLGRATRYTAEAFLSKMYIYLASCKEHHVGDLAPLMADGKNINGFDWVDAPSAWQKADGFVQDVFQNSGYRLADSYSDLFYPTTKGEQYNEFLFESESEQVEAWYLPGDFLVAEGDWPTNGGSGAPMRPSHELAMKYSTADLRYQHNIVRYIPFTNDPLFKIEKKGGKDFAIPLAFDPSQPDFISIGKVRQTMPYEYTIPAWAGVQNIPILRFAEVILFYAETRFKLGDEATARELLYNLRLRAAGGVATVADQLTADYRNTDFMMELMDERSRELVGEGQRRADLIRNGMYKSSLFGIQTEGAQYGYFNQSWKAIQENYADYKIWYPIVQDELSVNPNLLQNPGY